MGSYYDLDAILTDAEKMPCTFNLDLPGLGYLDDSQTEDIPKDSTHSLPLWLATLLSVNRLGASGQPICTLNLPDSIGGHKELNALKADARVVDLRAWNRFYWGLMQRCLDLWDEDELSDVGAEAFKIRAAEIADYAHNPRGAPAEFVQRLDEREVQLFKVARDSSRAVRLWLGEVSKKT